MRLKLSYMKPDFKRIGRFLTPGRFLGHYPVRSLHYAGRNEQLLVFYGNQSTVGGDVALSAMGVVMKIAMIMGGLWRWCQYGAQPILGFNTGAGNYHRLKKTY